MTEPAPYREPLVPVAVYEYDPATGQILIGRNTDNYAAPVYVPERGGEMLQIPGDWPVAGRQYYLPLVGGERVLTERPKIDLPDVIEVAANEPVVLPGLPDPATVVVDGEEYEFSGGEAELVFSEAATYTVEFSLWPWRPFRAEVRVV